MTANRLGPALTLCCDSSLCHPCLLQSSFGDKARVPVRSHQSAAQSCPKFPSSLRVKATLMATLLSLSSVSPVVTCLTSSSLPSWIPPHPHSPQHCPRLRALALPLPSAQNTLPTPVNAGQPLPFFRSLEFPPPCFLYPLALFWSNLPRS